MLTAAWVESFDVLGGFTGFADYPIGVFLGDQVLDFRCVMKQKHDELAGVCTHPLVDGQRQRDPKGAVSVRALAEKLVGVVWAELMGQGLDSLVHFPKERFVLG